MTGSAESNIKREDAKTGMHARSDASGRGKRGSSPDLPTPVAEGFLARAEEAGGAAILLDSRLRIKNITRTAARLLGIPRAKLAGGLLSNALPETLRETADASLRKAIAEASRTGQPASFPLRHPLTGQRFVVSVHPEQQDSYLVLCRETGAAAARLRRAAAAVRRITPPVPEDNSEERLHFVLHAAGMRAWEWDIASNRLTSRGSVFGNQEDEAGAVDTRTIEQFYQGVYAEDRERVRQDVERALAGTASFDTTFRFLTSDGRPRWVSSIGQVLRDTEGRAVRLAGITRDVTLHREAEERIVWQATHDILTDLPNRLHFLEQAQAAVALADADPKKGRALAVLFVDLDGFKRINDTLGHGIGDAVLQTAAKRLRAHTPPGSLVARQGGDEFTILLPTVQTEKEATEAAEQLLRALADPFSVAGHELYLTASIGISIYPYDGWDAEVLIRHADVAMYHAKERGRNNYQIHTEDMNRAAYDRLLLENDLRRALQSNEITVLYQPQIALSGGLHGSNSSSSPTNDYFAPSAPPHISAVEALMRWNHAEFGSVPRSRFIPLAEETGMIRALGQWIVRQACRQAREWEQSGQPVRVAVNLSARQLGHPGIVETVADALKETGLNPGLLELEITESALIWNGEAAVATAYRLKDLGVRLCVDDFGTGYSSLAYLRRFPLDAVKIDRSFVTELVQDLQARAIVRAVIDLAHALSLWVVAEGVETEAQRDLLSGLGCDLMQGYLFSRAVTADRLTELLTSGAKGF